MPPLVVAAILAVVCWLVIVRLPWRSAEFISSLQDEITPLFPDVLLVCAQEGLVGRQMFAVDGCKLSANCAKEWSGTHADLRKKKENLTAVGAKSDPLKKAVVVADNGFHSEENARLVLEQGLEAYLPDTKFRKRDPAFATAGRHRRPVARQKLRYRPRPFFGPSDFTYDSRKRTLICPAGKELWVKCRNFRNADGYVGTAYTGRIHDCRSCSLRSKCLRKSHTAARQVVIFRGRDEQAVPTFSQRMIERFDTARGRFLYSRRMGIVEPVFANLCHVRGLDHFTLRGRVKVDVQWKLYGRVHNILKILRFGSRFA